MLNKAGLIFARNHGHSIDRTSQEKCHITLLGSSPGDDVASIEDTEDFSLERRSIPDDPVGGLSEDALDDDREKRIKYLEKKIKRLLQDEPDSVAKAREEISGNPSAFSIDEGEIFGKSERSEDVEKAIEGTRFAFSGIVEKDREDGEQFVEKAREVADENGASEFYVQLSKESDSSEIKVDVDDVEKSLDEHENSPISVVQGFLTDHTVV